MSSDETLSVPLSEREREAMVLYASGLKIEAVARRMDVKPATAQEYIKRVRAKYSRAGAAAPTKTDLYRRAQEEGLVP
jgi:DNA-binding NarL/FixJ family response regulator